MHARTLAHAYVLQVMDAGTAAEYDSPSELLRNEDSIFASMVAETGKATAKFLRSVATGSAKLDDHMLMRVCPLSCRAPRRAATDVHSSCILQKTLGSCCSACLPTSCKLS
jgi:hypothetical protein